VLILLQHLHLIQLVVDGRNVFDAIVHVIRALKAKALNLIFCAQMSIDERET
jgi:hypothetical protein